MVYDRENDEGKRHAQKIEEQWGGVVEGVFDDDEGRSPDEDGGDQEKVRECARRKAGHGFEVTHSDYSVRFANKENLADAGTMMRRTVFLGLLFVVLAGCSMSRPVMGQTPAPPRATSTPYSGNLSIFDYPDRDKKLQIGRVMDLLGIKPGKNVADIGAGSGWFTVRAARRVGPRGTVFAEDINPQAIKYIDERVRREDLPNVKTVLGTPDDPKLAAKSVDAMLLMKMYHEIARPVDVMKLLRGSLKPGAKVGIIDRNGNGADHGLNRDVVEREMREAGYRLDARYDFTKADGQDYFLIFSAR
jgi:2-polyprenyl-3-methyl-5-hydroxy-6-metoxy-1,4-benzoquinol methylase